MSATKKKERVLPFYANIFPNSKDAKGFFITTMSAPSSMFFDNDPRQLMQSNSKLIEKNKYQFKAETEKEARAWIRHLQGVVG